MQAKRRQIKNRFTWYKVYRLSATDQVWLWSVSITCISWCLYMTSNPVHCVSIYLPLFYFNRFFIFLSNFSLQWQICHLHPRVYLTSAYFSVSVLENCSLSHTSYTTLSFAVHISHTHGCIPAHQGMLAIISRL